MVTPAGSESIDGTPDVASAEVALERDLFLRTLVRELAGELEDTVGLREASGYVSLVGQSVGDWLDADYRRALGVERMDRATVSEVLVDLKRRIQGDFYVISQDDETILLGNRACPFGDKVIGRPSMCMMTSNVFGSIAASNLGYARVTLEETIAEGHSGCRVRIDMRASDDQSREPGREYFE